MADIISLGAAEQVTARLLSILAHHDPETISDVLLIEGELVLGEQEKPHFEIMLFKSPSPRPVSVMNRTPRFIVIGTTHDREEGWAVAARIALHLGIRALDLTPLDQTDGIAPTGGAA